MKTIITLLSIILLAGCTVNPTSSEPDQVQTEFKATYQDVCLLDEMGALFSLDGSSNLMARRIEAIRTGSETPFRFDGTWMSISQIKAYTLDYGVTWDSLVVVPEELQ